MDDVPKQPATLGLKKLSLTCFDAGDDAVGKSCDDGSTSHNDSSHEQSSLVEADVSMGDCSGMAIDTSLEDG